MDLGAPKTPELVGKTTFQSGFAEANQLNGLVDLV